MNRDEIRLEKTGFRQYDILRRPDLVKLGEVWYIDGVFMPGWTHSLKSAGSRMFILGEPELEDALLSFLKRYNEREKQA